LGIAILSTKIISTVGDSESIQILEQERRVLPEASFLDSAACDVLFWVTISHYDHS
jgi:hypothetical protein